MLFCCFEALWGKFTKNSLLVKKLNLSERTSEILGKFVFFNKLEKGQIQRKIWISCNQPFLLKAVKLEKYKQKLFSPQNLPQTAKLYFSVVLKHFRGNSLKTSLFSQKIDSLRKKLRNTRKVCFFQQVRKGAYPEENLD